MRVPKPSVVAVILCAGALACACGSNSSEPSNAGSSCGATTNTAGSSAGTSEGQSAGETAAGGAAGGNAAGGNEMTGGSAATAGSGASAGSSGGAKTNSCKRGLAYGHHSLADLTALSPGVSWWYNWDFRPDQDLRAGVYRDLGVEYAPMIWGAKSDRSAAKTAIADDARVLLGFNEPNFGSQANLSAQAAAELWPELEAIAYAKNLRLVSPAVNFCGGDCQDTDPFHYLDAFFAACSGCRVDAVAIHIYVGCSPTGDNKAQYLINHVETYKKRFAQPLWLTEFACDSAKNDAE